MEGEVQQRINESTADTTLGGRSQVNADNFDNAINKAIFDLNVNEGFSGSYHEPPNDAMSFTELEQVFFIARLLPTSPSHGIDVVTTSPNVQGRWEDRGNFLTTAHRAGEMYLSGCVENFKYAWSPRRKHRLLCFFDSSDVANYWTTC